jgi:hypothetical protein
MSKYTAKFQGGPADGESQPLPKYCETFRITKVYNTHGFTTQSEYILSKQEGETLFFDLQEERFKGYYPEAFQG